MCVKGERGGIYVSFAYCIFAGDRENPGLKEEKKSELTLDF